MISVYIQRFGIPLARAPTWTTTLPLRRPICS
jgi:hypothetical protein